jgi:hypothetical protein
MANIADIAQTKAMLRRLARFNRASICFSLGSSPDLIITPRPLYGAPA